MRLEMHLQPDFLKMTFIDSKKKKKKVQHRDDR